jgi:phenylpyruvate tautomerase PptA (4-oxalocrotonate tautomerase family)
MPYIQFDVATQLTAATKRRMAQQVIALYAEIMQTAPSMVNVGIRELGPDNLWHLVDGELVPGLMILCDIRRGRPPEQRGRLAEALRAMAAAEVGVGPEHVVIEFTQHTADEMHRLSGWGREWSEAEGGAAPDAGDR